MELPASHESPRSERGPADGGASRLEGLEELGWLRRLALELVGPLWADDVVQDTLVAAWARPEPPNDRKAWLARVLRNLAFKHRRSEARRGERQAQAVRVDVPDGAHHGGPEKRLEVHQELLRAVASLEPSERDLVMRRYLDEVAPAKLALELGVPAGTVRSRLARALAKLRERFDDDVGRTNWLSALAPLAALPGPLLHTSPPPNGSAAALSNSVGAPGLAAGLSGALGGVMMWKWCLALVVAVLGVVGWKALDAPTDPAPSTGPERIAVARGPVTAVTAEAPPAPLEVPRTSAREAVAAPAAPEQAPPEVGSMRAVAFDVVDAETGAPLAGVALRLVDGRFLLAQNGALGGALGPVDAVSAEDGTIEHTYAANALRPAVFSKPGYAEVVTQTSMLGDDGARHTIPMWPVREALVRVTDPSGAPLAGLDVAFSVASEALAPSPELGAWSFGTNGKWDGRLRHRAEQPTGSFGEARVIGFPKEVAVHVELRRNGALVLATPARIEPTPAGDLVALELGAAWSLGGTLRDAFGAPLSDVTLQLDAPEAADDSALKGLRAKTDALGRFDFPVVPAIGLASGADPLDPGPGGLRVGPPTVLRGKGYGGHTVLARGEVLKDVALDWGAAEAGRLELALQTTVGLSIAGLVRQPNGAPYDSREQVGMVWVTRRGPDGRAGALVASAMPEGDAFRVDGLEPGSYALSFRMGNACGPEVVVDAGTTGVVLEAPLHGALAIVVRPGPGMGAGARIGNNMMVTAWPDGGGIPGLNGLLSLPETFAEEQSIDLESLAAGRYRVVVRMRSGHVGFSDVDVRAGTTTDVELALEPVGHIRFEPGLAIEPGLDGIRLLRDGRPIGWVDTPESTTALPPGPVLVEATAPDGTLRSTSVVVEAGETTDVRFE